MHYHIKTRTVDLEWVNIRRVISGVNGPKFSIFYSSERDSSL